MKATTSHRGIIREAEKAHEVSKTAQRVNLRQQMSIVLEKEHTENYL